MEQFSECDGKARVFHPRKRVNRKTKLLLAFDENARREFLTGFHKRKLQRKKKAQEELKQQLREERKRVKQEARESFKKLIVSHRPVPELENLISKNYELETHSVSIQELSVSDLAENNNWIGINKVQYEDEKNDDGVAKEDQQKAELPGMELKTRKDVKKIIKKQATKQVQKSKAFKLKNKIERQKNKKESLKKKKKRIKTQSNSKKVRKHGKKRK
ncbi:nucleolar protein 12 [Zootermopsis nevadensis]|uniref:Nucleolar protein 12 n=1 Tax=Zootermopsis nevadensis TaxID=136037 RepID=A0A067R271_ZOONE|nr:nucleolar protein 12 [Zootermopsis nevadensis]KDR13007.1 Nucleolar protein 12 [Zootermopsis nevadensis]